ncbi:sensor histidine kinase [Anaerolentibacter hominis]|uniref:sensor histidine kinase n=1 Tax=Anaerolentibacter hominis TaxID=3079009 RepID=UPI0031B82D92
MTIREFISDRLGGLLLHLISMTALTVFLHFTGTAGGVITLILIVWVLGLAVTLSVSYWKGNSHLQELASIIDGLDQKYLFAECIKKPKTCYERHLFDLLRRSGKSMIEAVSDARADQQEYREYIESWVHEVKAPITAAGLICRNADPEIRRKLSHELESINGHVERALFYARAKSPEKDFIIRPCSLKDLVTTAVDSHRALLIQSGVRVELEQLDYQVYTDSKWATFMLGQFIQNSVRYQSENPVITFSAKPLGQLVQLYIQDNGIGIPEHELPRIFDRGFTGSNGRTRGGSTGMGLYICRKLAALLSIEISVSSHEGAGVLITITFPAKENLSKM